MNKVVLIAEDNEINKILAQTIMQKDGWETHTAINGKLLMELYYSIPADLILMDIQMPVMNGLQAIQAIRQDEERTNKHIAIVAVTAYAAESDKKSILAGGADAYIAKPVQPKDLLTLIYDTLEKLKKDRQDIDNSG